MIRTHNGVIDPNARQWAHYTYTESTKLHEKEHVRRRPTSACSGVVLHDVLQSHFNSEWWEANEHLHEKMTRRLGRYLHTLATITNTDPKFPLVQFIAGDELGELREQLSVARHRSNRKRDYWNVDDYPMVRSLVCEWCAAHHIALVNRPEFFSWPKKQVFNAKRRWQLIGVKRSDVIHDAKLRLPRVALAKSYSRRDQLVTMAFFHAVHKPRTKNS